MASRNRVGATFCEAVHQVTVLRLFDSSSARPYIKIGTVAAVKDAEAVAAIGYASHAAYKPNLGSSVYGVFTVGADDTGIVFYFHPLHVEVRPISFTDNHRQSIHIPVHVRALGEVVQIEDNTFTVKVDTFVRHKVFAFSVRFHVTAPVMERVPPVGSYAGGRGLLLPPASVFMDGRPTPTLDLDMQSLHIGAMREAPLHVSTSGQQFIVPLIQQHASTLHKERIGILSGPSTVNSTTTFCEAYHRFLIVDTESSSRNVTIKTKDSAGISSDFAMTWPSSRVPPLHTMFDMVGELCAHNGRRYIVPVPTSIYIVPGDPSRLEYVKEHTLRSPCRIRASGKVVEINSLHFTIVGHVNLDTPFRVRYVAPQRSRWNPYYYVGVGEFIGGKGILTDVTDTDDFTIVVDVTELNGVAIETVEGALPSDLAAMYASK
ncbi:hypothetical protein CF319_g6844 [Tilletia indica]|nr:hypothetical protein CF319_g6844 [Tilletia indica]